MNLKPTLLLLLAAGGAAFYVSSSTTARRTDAAFAPAEEPPVPLVTGKAITPQGKQTEVGSFPVNAVLSPDRRFVVVTNTGSKQFVSALSVADGSLVSQVSVNGTRADGSNKKEGLYYGLAFAPPKTGEAAMLYVSRGAEDRISLFTLDAAGKLADTGRFLDNPSKDRLAKPHHVAGLAVSADGSRLYAVNNNTFPDAENRGSLSILDPAAKRVVANVPTSGFPFGVAVVTRGGAEKVYVSSERDGVVSVIDPQTATVTKSIDVGYQALALLPDRKQERLFVANAGSDTVSVVDTATDRVTRTILVRPDDARGLPGATPTGLALSPDEKRLYVTLADMNAVAVVELPKGRLLGYVPVGWYPTSVVVAPDGKRLFVTNAKGVNRRNPNGPPERPSSFAPGSGQYYVQNVVAGTVSTVDVPDGGDLKRLTQMTIANNRIAPNLEKPLGFKNPGIEHVIYLIKENRTYDQVLGDLPQGNGDPKLCFFPREVTPNQHALAERFVLLDNFYCSAEVSADGWNWSTAGMASEYTARNAPYGYSGRGRNYDYEGQNNESPVDLNGVRDVATPPGGYIWDRVAAKKIPFRNYGFFVNVSLTDDGIPVGRKPSNQNTATKQVLAPQTDTYFRQFDMAYADSDAWVLHNTPAPAQLKTFGKFNAKSRYEEWKREFDSFVTSGKVPRFMMLRLPHDHTQGTAPGFPSPRACNADNDYGVGQIVEAISKSPIWKKTAIFILEDDAQNGFDHVDAHRSIAYVISPFVKRSSVDHRFYNTDSVLRTMELIMGLAPMNQYDAVAPVLDVFSVGPDNADPYQAILPAKAIVGEVNGRTAYRAKDSQRLDFTKEDAVPDDLLNDILWHGIMGRNKPKPEVRYGLRVRPVDDEDEAEERERERD